MSTQHTTSTQTSAIVALEVENVKRIKALRITPAGNMIVIGGDNGAGKSSVLDSIAMGVGGKDEIPTVPVRRGEEKARILIELDNGLVIRRTFTKAGGTALVVENKDKMRAPSPQELLSKLTGKLMFDPLAFIGLGEKEQANTLKRLVGLDLSALDARRKALYDERTLVNRQAEQARARVEILPHHPQAPVEEVSVAAIVAERDAAKEHNAKAALLNQAVAAAKTALVERTAKNTTLAAQIATMEQELARLRKLAQDLAQSLPALGEQVATAEKALADFRPVDVEPINHRLMNAETVNRAVRQNLARAQAEREAQAVAAKAQALTSQIVEIDRQKDEALASTKFPVAGLSFDQETGGVVFNGVPFDQASGAEKLRISVAIAAALNPTLRVMLVRDGALLDEKSLQLLGELAVEHNLQCWVERVGKGAECSVIIEDGEIEAKAEQTAAA